MSTSDHGQEGEQSDEVVKKSVPRAKKISISREELEDTVALFQDVPLRFGVNRKVLTRKERMANLAHHKEYQEFLSRLLAERSEDNNRNKRRFWFFRRS